MRIIFSIIFLVALLAGIFYLYNYFKNYGDNIQFKYGGMDIHDISVEDDGIRVLIEPMIYIKNDNSIPVYLSSLDLDLYRNKEMLANGQKIEDFVLPNGVSKIRNKFMLTLNSDEYSFVGKLIGSLAQQNKQIKDKITILIEQSNIHYTAKLFGFEYSGVSPAIMAIS